MHTPWGTPQQSKQIADGITWYSTASHGGFHVSARIKASMPEPYRSIKTFAGGNWYEEDCDWSIVALAFPEYFPDIQLDAKQCFDRWIAPKLNSN